MLSFLLGPSVVIQDTVADACRSRRAARDETENEDAAQRKLSTRDADARKRAIIGTVSRYHQYYVCSGHELLPACRMATLRARHMMALVYRDLCMGVPSLRLASAARRRLVCRYEA